MATPNFAPKACADNCGTYCPPGSSCYSDKLAPPGDPRCRCFPDSAPPPFENPWVKKPVLKPELTADEIYKTHLSESRAAFGVGDGGGIILNGHFPVIVGPYNCRCLVKAGCVGCPEGPTCWWMDAPPGGLANPDIPPKNGRFECHKAPPIGNPGWTPKDNGGMWKWPAD